MEFIDRVSAYPNRYVMTDENGNTSLVYLERADEPTVPGTPLNAETFDAMADAIKSASLPLSGGTMTGSMSMGGHAISGVHMGGLYWDDTGTVFINIPGNKEVSSKWAMVICAASPGEGNSSLFFVSGQSAGVVDKFYKICGYEGHGIGFSISSWGTLKVVTSKWSHGWYMVNGALDDLNT